MPRSERVQPSGLRLTWTVCDTVGGPGPTWVASYLELLDQARGPQSGGSRAKEGAFGQFPKTLAVGGWGLAAAQHFRGHRSGRRVFTGHSRSPGTTTGQPARQLE